MTLSINVLMGQDPPWLFSVGVWRVVGIVAVAIYFWGLSNDWFKYIKSKKALENV